MPHLRNLQNVAFEHLVILLGRSLLVIDYCVMAVRGPHADRYSHLWAFVLIKPICQMSEKMQPNALLQGMQEEALCIKSRREASILLLKYFFSIVSFQTYNKVLFQGLCQMQFPLVFTHFSLIRIWNKGACWGFQNLCSYLVGRCIKLLKIRITWMSEMSYANVFEGLRQC